MTIMVTVGCAESGDGGRLHLVRATKPEALQDRMPYESHADTPLGARTVGPTGTMDKFGVPVRTDHKVWAKRLLNPDATGGADPLDLTSITTLSSSCKP